MNKFISKLGHLFTKLIRMTKAASGIHLMSFWGIFYEQSLDEILEATLYLRAESFEWKLRFGRSLANRKAENFAHVWNANEKKKSAICRMRIKRSFDSQKVPETTQSFQYFDHLYFIYCVGLFSLSYRSYGSQTWPIKWNAVSSKQRSCRYCCMDAPLGC